MPVQITAITANIELAMLDLPEASETRKELLTALAALWIASVVACVLLFSSRRPSDRWISGLLAAHWIWSALAYHAAFFTRINPAAWLFAVLFLIQAALFLWIGLQQRVAAAGGIDVAGVKGQARRHVLQIPIQFQLRRKWLPHYARALQDADVAVIGGGNLFTHDLV